mmetsp:Transcript_142456/g.442963  ORF Transcript_142456/g.442963 Transcript_142456/m.442963 type:complete len:220 (+) Transcript_142456:797-1456(+)
MLLWPPQTYTSPKRTSSSRCSPPVDTRKAIVCGPPAGVGGSPIRQMPSDPVWETSSVPLKLAVTTALGGANPHTTAEAGARCRTMWLPSVLESLKSEFVSFARGGWSTGSGSSPPPSSSSSVTLKASASDEFPSSAALTSSAELSSSASSSSSTAALSAGGGSALRSSACLAEEEPSSSAALLDLWKFSFRKKSAFASPRSATRPASRIRNAMHMSRAG